jgi:hypothetical protein
MVSAVQKLKDFEAEWMAKATDSAIEGVREAMGGINSRAAIGSLSKPELGWIAMGAVFNWIKCKSEQAAAEGFGFDGREQAIRSMPGREIPPWDLGALTSILPALGDVEGLPWDKPLNEWSKQQMVRFTWNAHRLICAAMSARDDGAPGKLMQKVSLSVAEREFSARNGGPLLSRKELGDDDIPF